MATEVHMSARLAPPLRAAGQLHLLSAGPRAGKTRSLQHWATSWGDGARYHKLPRPSRLGAALFEQLLAHFPEARPSFKALAAKFPRLSPGAVLAFALEECCPSAALLLDDWHLAEGGPDEEGLRALIRHFPAQGTLALASRHRLPSFGRHDAVRWDADHAAWAEAPEPQDLRPLSSSLVAAFLALHLLKGLPMSAEGAELIRLNLARRTPHGDLALRSPWQPVAEQMLASEERGEVWERLAGTLTAHLERHLRTPRELVLREAWQRLPASARAPHDASWQDEPLPSDAEALHALLELPVRDDRRAQHRHLRALAALDAHSKAQGDATNAQTYAERMVGFASRHGLVCDLLRAHVAHLDAQMLGAAPNRLASLLSLPVEAFGARDSLADLLRCLRDRAHLLGEPEIARNLEALWRREFEALPLPELPAGPPRGPARLRVRALGTFALRGTDGSSLHFGRRKALLLLALLTLQPQGLSLDEVQAILFDGPHSVDSLYSTTYAARRCLKEAGFEHLLEWEGGYYRLRWQEVAFCDLHEHETLKKCALLLESRGMSDAARLLHAIAQAYVSGPVLGELAEELPEGHAWLVTQFSLESGGTRAL